MIFRRIRLSLLKKRKPQPKPVEEPKVIEEPKIKQTVYVVSNGDEVTYCYSIEDILDKFPTMKRRGINLVLTGKQKTHAGYTIIKDTI